MEVKGYPYMALQVLLVLYGIWSLDFFRSVIPPFCANSNIKTVHALALGVSSSILSHLSHFTHLHMYKTS